MKRLAYEEVKEYIESFGDDIEMSIMIIISLLGFTVGTKIYSLWKMAGLDVDHMSKKEIETLVKQEFMFDQLPKQYLKYMR